MPVAWLRKFLLDDISNQKNLAAAKHRTDNERCQSRYKYHRNAADDTRNGKRECHAKESLDGICTQVFCCIDDVLINFGQRIIKRQYHKRQKIIYHT